MRLLLRGGLRDLGVVIHDAVLHFDVTALTGKAGAMRQATDVLGTIPLTVGGKTVHVVRAALESKGERGVAGGVRQLLKLDSRFVAGSPVTTERGNFTVGKDLFLSVEEALAALGASKEASRRVAGTVAASDCRAASPSASALGQAGSGQRILDASPPEGEGPLRTTATTSRAATMAKVAEGLAPAFGLQARSL